MVRFIVKKYFAAFISVLKTGNNFYQGTFSGAVFT